jgi:hypothetical protein
MAKFKVTDKIACWVTWTYEIEAADSDEAIEKYLDGDHGGAVATEIGGSLDWAGDAMEAEEIKT